MYYITKRDSETSKKLAAVIDQMEAANTASADLCKDLGGESGRIGYWCVAGGISCILFKNPPPKELWKRVEDGWMPKGNVKEGKKLFARIKELPKVFYQDLNDVLGHKEPFGHFGYNPLNEEYLGIKISEKWDITMPADCEEVTKTRYQEIFSHE
jgi:hypothetical protein